MQWCSLCLNLLQGLIVFVAGNCCYLAGYQVCVCIYQPASNWFLFYLLAAQWKVKSFYCDLFSSLAFVSYLALCSLKPFFSSSISASCFDIRWFDILFFWRTSLSKWGPTAATTCLANSELAKQSLKSCLLKKLWSFYGEFWCGFLFFLPLFIFWTCGSGSNWQNSLCFGGILEVINKWQENG